MTRSKFLELLNDVRIWQRGNSRAPHKPLLLLLALGRVSRGEPDRLAPYDWFHDELLVLLEDYGPWRPVQHPHMPFWRMQRDGLWEIPEADAIRRAGRVTTSGDVAPRTFREFGARGGLPEPVHTLLASDPALVEIAAQRLLDGHFAESVHHDIRDAVGMASPLLAAEGTLEYGFPRKPRDPNFRRLVISAYERRCAMCDFDVRLDDRLLGLEAAHIQWHACDGPDEVPNGLALCSQDHRFFDRGAIGLRAHPDPEKRTYHLIVSSELSGGSPAYRQLVKYSGQPLRPPQAPRFLPDPAYVRWHRREVFRGHPRI